MSPTNDLTLCPLQPPDPDGFVRQACAQPLPYGGVLLTSHDVPATAEEDEEIGLTMAHIELTAEGWRTLVELFALRRSEAFGQTVAKWQAFREAMS